MDVSLIAKKDMELVSGCFLFKGTDESFVRRALSDDRCTVETYNKSDVIYDLSDYRKNIGFILDGVVEAQKLPPGSGRFVMNRLMPGNVFGVAALFNENAGYVTRLAVSVKCRVVFFPQELLVALMKEEFIVAQNYMTFLSGRIHFLNEKINGLLISGTERTLRHWISEGAREENGHIFTDLNVSMSSLAEMLHMGRASLYRSFDELESDGLIKRDGKRIEILVPEKLLRTKE